MCGFDFVAAPLVHPRYRRPAPQALPPGVLLPPFTRSDLLLTSSQWTGQVSAQTPAVQQRAYALEAVLPRGPDADEPGCTAIVCALLTYRSRVHVGCSCAALAAAAVKTRMRVASSVSRCIFVAIVFGGAWLSVPPDFGPRCCRWSASSAPGSMPTPTTRRCGGTARRRCGRSSSGRRTCRCRHASSIMLERRT